MNKEKESNIFWKHPFTWVCLFAIGYWLYSYHLEHALGVLPYAILILCPLMHIFMHHGHGGHSGHSEDGRDRKDKGDENAR
jgi:hypothetical protein